MPYNCCVPNCHSISNRDKDLMFHKFPKDQRIVKKWLIAIRSGKKPTKYTKICSKHFVDSDYNVTSLGKLPMSTNIVNCYFYQIILLGEWKILKYSTAIPSQHLPLRKFETLSREGGRKTNRSGKLIETLNNVEPLDDIEVQVMNDEEGQNEQHLLHNNDEEVQTKTFVDKNIQTVITFKRSQLISFSFLSNVKLKQMTGFTKELFIFFTDYFGSSYHKCNPGLSLQDELLLVLIKYKLNMYNCTLASLFDVSPRIVTNIIISWSRHLYKCFKQIDFWKLRSVDKGQYDAVLDCTEFRIERSTDPVIQQSTYSTYYQTNTFKALVGGTEKGAICFVSDVYGGSISDRCLTERSGFLDLLKEGQYILADRGFDISDLLETKGVCLNIPPFKTGEQLSEEEVATTRAIANRRIIIENLIGSAKRNKILADRISSKFWPIINEIVYNIFMIINFKKGIVKL